MLNIKEFPQDMSSFSIDSSNMKKCLVSGLFRETVKVHDKERVFYTYITPGLTYNQPCLIIAPSDNVQIQEFIENGFWEKFAEK